MLKKFNLFIFIGIIFNSYSQVDIGPQNKNDTINLNQLTDYITKNYFSKTPNIEAYTDRAIALAIKLNDKNTQANLYRMAGVIQYFNGKHDKALKYYLDAIKLFEYQQNKIGLVDTYNEIGTLYRKNNRLVEALEIFSKGLSIAKAMNDTSNMAKSINNSGIVYEVQNNLPLALNQYFKALNLYISIKDTIGQSYCHENIGGIYLMQDAYKPCEKHLLISYNFRKIKKLEQSMAFSLHYLGELYIKKGENSKALKSYTESAEIGQKIKYPDIIQRAYYSISEVYSLNKNYAQAFQYYKKATVLKDSIFNAERNFQITEMQTKYDVENKNKENLLLKQKVEIEKQAAKSQNLLYIFTTIILLILIIGGLLYFIRKRQLSAIQTQLKITRAEQQQRFRISNDLHDNVGAQLSFVVSNLDIANAEIANNKLDKKRIQSIAEMSKNAILTLRETVWALNNTEISIESFSDKFKVYAHKMTEFSDNLNLNFNENISINNVLQPNTALHLFRICQESFSNAIKHSNATIIEIEIGNSNKLAFYFKISDNGIGFSPDDAKQKGHYGLQNMQHRAKEVGAEYLLQTTLNHGTIIQLNLPI